MTSKVEPRGDLWGQVQTGHKKWLALHMSLEPFPTRFLHLTMQSKLFTFFLEIIITIGHCIT